jgi:glycerol-3-phosphate acyltransferase PlsX
MEGVREQIQSSLVGKLGARLMRPALHAVRRRIDYQEYGGAPLLGVDGIVIIGHGGSSVKAFGNAIRVAALAVERKLNRHIEEAVRDFDFGSQGEEPVEVKLGEQAARR